MSQTGVIGSFRRWAIRLCQLVKSLVSITLDNIMYSVGDKKRYLAHRKRTRRQEKSVTRVVFFTQTYGRSCQLSRVSKGTASAAPPMDKEGKTPQADVNGSNSAPSSAQQQNLVQISLFLTFECLPFGSHHSKQCTFLVYTHSHPKNSIE
jgi:hypothetical protein